jgi:hypothetical protein
MATFRKTEVVDCRQFTGGVQNGQDILLWVNSRLGKASHTSGGASPEFIRIYRDYASLEFELVFVGDWVIQNQDGTFRGMRPEALVTEGYKQV